MPRECGGLSRCATPLRLVRKLPSLLGERIARADRAAWCRRSRRARDRTHFAVDTPELEDLAALAAELHGRRAGLKTRVEGDDQLIGAAREVRADADQPVALEAEMHRGVLRASLHRFDGGAQPGFRLGEDAALAADVDRALDLSWAARPDAVADRIGAHDKRHRNGLVVDRCRNARGLGRAGDSYQRRTCANTLKDSYCSPSSDHCPAHGEPNRDPLIHDVPLWLLRARTHRLLRP